MDANHGIYSKQPGFTPEGARQLFQKITDVRTLVIYCLDPRAQDIPAAVAREFGESWPGDLVRDERGNKIAFTANVGQIVSAGGRSVDALRSITQLNQLLGIKKVAVVHHTFCGMTAFRPDAVLDTYKHEHGHDLSKIYDDESIYISDFEHSLRYDVALLRNAPGVPKTIELYGFVYDIDDEKLIKVVEDRVA